MLEIDIARASSNQAKSTFYMSDDTDISEVDTALNTPIGSSMDSSVKRFSTTSSTSSFSTLKSYRKPSIAPKSSDDIIPLLEKRLHLMEQELSEHIKRELDLEAQLLQQKKNSYYKTALDRMNKRIDQFFQSKHHIDSASNQLVNLNSFDYYDWLIGNELPALYGTSQEGHNVTMQPPCNTVTDGENNSNACGNVLSFNKIFIYRLKSIVKQYHLQGEFCDQFYNTLNAWEQYEDQCQLKVYEQQEKDNNRVSRLMDALNRSLLKNKILRKDSNIIVKKHQSDLKKIMKERNFYKDQINKRMQQKQEKRQGFETKQQTTIDHQMCEEKMSNLSTALNHQIKELDKALLNCQEERDEYESTVEMVRREMESMLEELEDTRQQRLRFKTQASRLRAGLEALQKKKKSSLRESKNTNENPSSSEDEEEDEATEAIRLVCKETERQAMDLERECKRQALTLNSVRKELKLAEEKYHTLKNQKNKKLHQLEQDKHELARKVDLLTVEKQNLSISLDEYQQKLNEKSNTLLTAASTEDDDEEKLCMYQAKIYTLQIALKVAISDASIQRAKIFQLERQASLLDFSQSIVQLQTAFQSQVAFTFQLSEDHVNKRVADSIEHEQALWKSKCENLLQKKYDIGILQANRELRLLSGHIVELEDEIETSKLGHKEELKRVKYQVEEEINKKLQKTISQYKSKEQKLLNELDVLYQTNQTLQDELLVLCGRNLRMANQLGNIK